MGINSFNLSIIDSNNTSCFYSYNILRRVFVSHIYLLKKQKKTYYLFISQFDQIQYKNNILNHFYLKE